MGNLAKHQRTVHRGVKYPCIHCEYLATLKGSFAEHQMVVHKASMKDLNIVEGSVKNNFQ